MPLKKFNIVVGQTDAEGSPPPPPAPSGPVAPQFHSDVGQTFSIADSYSGATSYAPAATSYTSAVSPQMSAYYTKRYSSEPTSAMPRYTSSYQQQPQSQQQQQHPYTSVQQSAVVPDMSSYYTGRYTDYTSRYPTYGTATTPEATSPGWRRRSYDPDVDYNVATRRVPTVASVTSSFGRPLTDLTSTGSAAANLTPAALALARSRSRSRVSASELESSYMRYVAPSTANTHVTPSSLISGMRPGAGSSGLTSRPMSSGYLYGHGPGTYGGYHYVSPVTGGDLPPHAPPGYNAREREVSARIRRYQQQPPPES